MSNTPARIPYSWLSVGPPRQGTDAQSQVASAYEVNRELQRIQRQQTGMFQPRVVVHGMGGSPSPYIVRATDWQLLVDASGGAITITFPDAARLDGLFVTIIKTDSSTNAVTLSATINGVSNPTLLTQYASQIAQSGNGVWYATPRLTAPDIGPGKFPSGDYEFPANVKIDGHVSIGTTVASIGDERVASGFVQAGRNSANSANITLVSLLTTNDVVIGGSRAVPIANNASATFGTTQWGDVIVSSNNDKAAKFFVSNSTIVIISDPSSAFSVTSGTASKTNVFLTGAALTVENKTGSNALYGVTRTQ